MRPGQPGGAYPEEMPIIAAAILSRAGVVRRWLALPSVSWVCSGDMALYWVGRHWGADILTWRVVRLVLTPTRSNGWKRRIDGMP